MISLNKIKEVMNRNSLLSDREVISERSKFIKAKDHVFKQLELVIEVDRIN